MWCARLRYVTDHAREGRQATGLPPLSDALEGVEAVKWTWLHMRGLLAEEVSS